MNKIGIDLNGFNYHKIGDCISLSSIPENIFVTNGSKIVDMHKLWVYDYNPYVLRDVDPDKVMNFCFNRKRFFEQVGEFTLPNIHQANSSICGANISLGGPRLYKYEDIKPAAKTLCVHVTPHGKEMRDNIPDEVLKTIRINYSDYNIVQVGGKNDKKFDGAIDYRGTSIWEMVKIIASSEIFIGISSGPIHIADCYNHVRKKIIIFGNIDDLVRFKPRSSQYMGGDWINYNWEYYNLSEIDIGATRSYLKI